MLPLVPLLRDLLRDVTVMREGFNSNNLIGGSKYARKLRSFNSLLLLLSFSQHNKHKLLYPFHFHKSVKKPEPIPNSTSKIPDCHTYCFLREAWLK